MLNSSLFKMSIRKNDQVQVITGREKGKRGKVLRVLPKSGRVLVEKVNLVKRHIRPTQKNPQGGVIEKEAPLHYSNVLLLCPTCNRGVRHGVKVDTKGKEPKGKKTSPKDGKLSKVRICKRCGEVLNPV